MGESLTTENAYLSVSSFPVVVLTECGLLSDLERTTVMEQLEDLMDQSERHALVIDLTEGEALPEKQRIYVAEAIQMRAKTIVEKWAALAVVVAGPEHQRMSKAEFWIGVCPVPGRVFPTLETAMAWAQECVAPIVATEQAPEPNPTPAERASRLSRTGPVPRPIDRGALNHKAPSNSSSLPVRAATTTVKGGKELPAGSTARMLAKIGRKGLVAASILGVAALLLLLGPAGDGQLSAAEAREFERLKSRLALRVYRDTGKGERPLATGEKSAPADKLGFEVDIPAKGYMMVMGAKADGRTYSIFPGRGRTAASRIDLGAKQRLPVAYTLDETKGKESLYLVYCPMRFELADCKASGKSGVSCSSDCVTADFALEK